jgi:hypothetical protein
MNNQKRKRTAREHFEGEQLPQERDLANSICSIPCIRSTHGRLVSLQRNTYLNGLHNTLKRLFETESRHKATVLVLDVGMCSYDFFLFMLPPSRRSLIREYKRSFDLVLFRDDKTIQYLTWLLGPSYVQYEDKHLPDAPDAKPELNWTIKGRTVRMRWHKEKSWYTGVLLLLLLFMPSLLTIIRFSVHVSYTVWSPIGTVLRGEETAEDTKQTERAYEEYVARVGEIATQVML